MGIAVGGTMLYNEYGKESSSSNNNENKDDKNKDKYKKDNNET